MKIEKISVTTAPKVIGPYSQGISAGDFIFVSGQIAPLPGSSIAEETEQVLKNLDAILSASGSSLKNVVQTTVYLKNLEDFAEMNEVYAKFFQEPYPARSTVEVSALPKSARIEISAIAIRARG